MAGLNVKAKFSADTSSAKLSIENLNKTLQNFNKLNDGAKRGLDNLAHGVQALAGSFAIIKDSYSLLNKFSGSFNTFINTADEIANLNSRLKLASASTAEYISQQKALLNIANSSYSKH